MKTTTLNRAQAEELMKRTEIAIAKQFPSLSFDRAELLQSAIMEDFFAGEFTSLNADPIPSIGTLAYIAKCKFSKKVTGIFENKIIEKRNRTHNRSAAEFNLAGETSSYDSKYYRTTSLESLQEETDYEPATDSYEQILINNTKSIQELQREAFMSNPMFNGIVKAAVAHVNAGGTFKSFAVKMGYASGQSLKNRMIKQVKMAQTNSFLPFTEYVFNDAPKIAKTPKRIKRVDSNLQLPLF